MQSLGVLFKDVCSLSMQLVNKVGVDRQIANERVVLGEGKGFLFTLFAEQTRRSLKR